MVEAVETMDGWYSLHDIRKIDWTSWKLASSEEREAAITEFEHSFGNVEAIEEAENGSHVMYKAIGQSADLMFMFLRPTMEEIADLETAFNNTKFAEYLIPPCSNVSVVELSKYAP